MVIGKNKIEVPQFAIFQNDKTTIIVACSKHDFDYMLKNNKDNEIIILKANPLCQLISQK